MENEKPKSPPIETDPDWYRVEGYGEPDTYPVKVKPKPA